MGRKNKNPRRADIESALKNIGERTPQIDLEAVKAAHKVVPAEIIKDTDRPADVRARYAVPARRRFAYAIAAMLAIIILAGVPVGAVSYDVANTTELYIDAEDSVKLVVGPFGRVRSAELLSYDDVNIGELTAAAADIGTGKGFLFGGQAKGFAALFAVSPAAVMATDTLSSTDGNDNEIADRLAELRGKKVSAAVDKLINYLADNDMLPEGCELIISTAGKNNKRAGKVAELARSAALTNQSGLLDGENVTVIENMREAGKNISPAKLRFLKEAIIAGTGYTEEELKNFSAGYLRYLAKIKAGGSESPSVSRRAEKYYEIYLRRLEKKSAEKGNNGKGKGQGSGDK